MRTRPYLRTLLYHAQGNGIIAHFQQQNIWESANKIFADFFKNRGAAYKLYKSMVALAKSPYLSILNGPYLLDYASPGHKPYICELAPNLLLMPINFVLGQIDIQTVIRHDLDLLTDLFPGGGTLEI